MSITISSCFPGHWEREYTTTTTITIVGSSGFGDTSTMASDSFKRGVNRLGQAGVQINFYNESDKAIRRVTFRVVPVNRLGDELFVPVPLSINGPIKKHSVCKPVWNHVWTNPSIVDVKVLEATIDYMDGSTEKQSLSPQNGEKKLVHDSAVGYTLICPLILGGLLLAPVIYLMIVYHQSMRSYRMYISPTLSYFAGTLMLTILLCLATVFVSRYMKNKAATFATGIAAMAVPLLYCAVGLFKGYHDIGPNGFSLIFYGGTIITCIFALLCMFNVLKRSYCFMGTMSTTMTAVLTVLFLVIFGYWGYLLCVDEAWFENLGLYFFLTFAMLFWGLLATVANRFRTQYDT